MVGSGNDAVVLVGHALGCLVFVAFVVGFYVVGEEFKGLVKFVNGGFVVLAQPELTGIFHQFVETSDFLVVELFLLSGLGQFLLGQFVVGEDLTCRLKLHDGGIEIVFGQQALALAHGNVVSILFVLAFLEDGAHGIGLTTNIFVLGEDL